MSNNKGIKMSNNKGIKMSNNKTEKPLISFVLLAYKHQDFIEEAVNAALAQDYSPLEIILSDDNSPDNTFEIMQNIVSTYKGKHKIILNRNSQNLGLINHYNRCVFELSNGSIIVFAGGDDISFPERCTECWKVMNEHPEVNCIESQNIKIDKNGKEITSVKNTIGNKLKIYTQKDYFIKQKFRFHGATMALRRDAIIPFGPLRKFCGVEDSPGLLRCVLTGSVASLLEPTIYYRIHGNNMTTIDCFKEHEIIGLYAQMLRDIRFAYKKGLISPKEKDMFEKMVKRRTLKKIINKKHRNSKGLKHFKFTLKRAWLSFNNKIIEKINKYSHSL